MHCCVDLSFPAYRKYRLDLLAQQMQKGILYISCFCFACYVCVLLLFVHAKSICCVKLLPVLNESKISLFKERRLAYMVFGLREFLLWHFEKFAFWVLVQIVTIPYRFKCLR